MKWCPKSIPFKTNKETQKKRDSFQHMQGNSGDMPHPISPLNPDPPRWHSTRPSAAHRSQCRSTSKQWPNEIQFAPPEKLGNHDSLASTNQQWLPMVSKWSIHSMGSHADGPHPLRTICRLVQDFVHQQILGEAEHSKLRGKYFQPILVNCVTCLRADNKDARR